MNVPADIMSVAAVTKILAVIYRSIPRMCGVQGHEVHQHDAGWLPVYTDNTKTLGVMSIGFLLTNQVDL